MMSALDYVTETLAGVVAVDGGTIGPGHLNGFQKGRNAWISGVACDLACYKLWWHTHLDAFNASASKTRNSSLDMCGTTPTSTTPPNDSKAS